MGRAVKLGLVMLAILVMGPVSRSFAQVATLDMDAVDKPEVRTTITAGLGVGVLPEYEGSEDYKGTLAPFFRASSQNGMYVQLLGTTLLGNVLPSKNWELGPLVRYRAPRDNVENDAVNEMEKINAAVEVGGFAGFKFQGWSLRAEAASDVKGSYNGYVVTVKGGYTIPLNDRASVGFNLAATYADENYMQTYFGVNRENALRSGLSLYDADAGIKDVAATVLGTYRFTPNWGLMGAVRVTRLLGDAADSPIVDDEGSATQMLAAVLVTYTF